jgi:hypothetical protein
MKKIIIVLMFILTLGFSISTTYAYKPYTTEQQGTSVPFYYDFNVVELATDYHAMVITEQDIPSESNILYVNIPADGQRTPSANGVDAEISFYDSLSDLWIDYFIGDLLFPGDTMGDEIHLTIRFNALADLGSILGDVTSYNFTKFKITLPLIYQILPTSVSESLKYNYYYDNTTIAQTILYYKVYFYDRLEFLGQGTVTSSSIPDVPVRDADPANMKFIGWYSLQELIGTETEGLYHPITVSGANAYQEVTNNDLEFVENSNIGILKLFARYQDKTSGAITPPTFENDMPFGINAIFATFGMNNNTGYTIFFIFILLVMFLLFASLKLPLIVYFIGGISTSLFFMFFGIMPIYLSIIVILLMVVTFFGINLGGSNYE